MDRTSRNFPMFQGEQVKDFLAKHTHQIQASIYKEPEDYILNVNEKTYISCLMEEFKLETPHIDFDSVQISGYEKMISTLDYPAEFPFARPRETVPRHAVVYHLPFTGSDELFHCTPSRYKELYPNVYIEDHYVCFELINFNAASDDTEVLQKNAAKLEKQAQAIIDQIKFFADGLIIDAEPYTTHLSSHIEQRLKARKEQLLKNNKLLAFLNVPLKKRDDVSGTYAIPTPQTRKPLLMKPSVTEKGYKPEPTLDQTTYQEILQIIHDVGKMFERLPATYFRKGEEDLRDHLLLYLVPRFKDEGSVTGETFNKVGKTDILYRYRNSNAFIAECKFWGGQAQYLKTITQLLSYLTWRDSKAAVIIFVDNREISSVLETVKEVTPQHPNYLGFVDEQDTSWFNYRFHINDDPNREVKLAVMLYHIPDIYGGRVKTELSSRYLKDSS